MDPVDVHSPEFATARSAVAATLGITEAAAGDGLKTFSATQIQRVVNATAAKSEEHQHALVKVALAQNLAEQATATAHQAEMAVARLAVEHSVEGAAADLISQTQDLAEAASSHATSAAAAVEKLDQDEQAASETKVATDETTTTETEPPAAKTETTTTEAETEK